MRAAGFVLVGGRSTRMGQDKALLLSRSLPLAKDVANKVAVAAGSVALVGRPERYHGLDLETIPDRRPDSGPLGGIEAALQSGRGELNLIVACDMPGLEVSWLIALLQKARHGEAWCTVARDREGTIHPLCAVYRTVCLPTIQRALDEGRFRVIGLVKEMAADILEIPDMIWNVNTPLEWNRWQRQQQFSDN